MQMEYEQPIHIEHETESTDEETENPTEDSFRITFWLDDAIQILIGWCYTDSYWMMLDLIPRKSEKLEGSKNFAIT